MAYKYFSEGNTAISQPVMGNMGLELRIPSYTGRAMAPRSLCSRVFVARPYSTRPCLREGTPLVAAKRAEWERVKQSARNCQDENHPEYKIYGSFLVANLSRYQLAAEVIREALAAVRANPQLHRHKIKQQCTAVRASVERYDSMVGNATTDIDLFDEVTDATTKSAQHLLTPVIYSVQQKLLTEGFGNTHEFAMLEVAVALLQECERMHQNDVDQLKVKCPWVEGMKFGSEVFDLKTLRSVRRLVFDASVPKGAQVDLNEDQNIKTAWNNLIKTIGHGKIFHDAANQLVEA